MRRLASNHHVEPSMIELPLCRWRRELTVEGHHKCRSPKLVHGPNGVRDELCVTCHLCNHPRPPLFAWLRLMFLASLPILRVHARRWLTFALALARHVAAGLPLASDEEVAARKAKCDPCWRRDKVKDECTLCGCKLAGIGGKKKLASKQRWAREKCPMWEPEQGRPWGWGPVAGETIFRRLLRRLFRVG